MERNQKNKSKGNGEGTIYTSKTTGLYIAQYWYNGKRKSLYQKKYEKAGDFKKRFNDILSSINTNAYIENNPKTVEKIIENHIEQKNKDGITCDNSCKRDRETLEQIKKCCSNFVYKQIQKVTIYDIEKSKENMKKYKKSGINRMWRLLFKAFRIASSPSVKLIPYNIMDDENLKKPVSDKITEKVKPLTVEEEKRLNEILDNEERNHKYRNIVKLELITSMRIGEVLARSKDNIDTKYKKLLIDNTLTEDLDGNTILGKHTKTYDKTTGTDNGVRNFPINEEIEEIINEQINKKITNIYGLLFWDYEKNTFITPKEVNAWLKRLNKKYKITNNLHTHRLRHTPITRWKEQGVDIRAIQYLAGHVEGSEITDKVYIDVSEDFAFKELEKAI